MFFLSRINYSNATRQIWYDTHGQRDRITEKVSRMDEKKSAFIIQTYPKFTKLLIILITIVIN